MQILEKYKQHFNINETYDVSDVQQYKDNILNFGQFLRKAVPIMETQKQQIKRMIETRELQNAAYTQIVLAVTKYEDNNVEYYSESDVSRKIITNPVTGSEFVEKYSN
jgi:hypothetical protein